MITRKIREVEELFLSLTLARVETTENEAKRQRDAHFAVCSLTHLKMIKNSTEKRTDENDEIDSPLTGDNINMKMNLFE